MTGYVDRLLAHNQSLQGRLQQALRRAEAAETADARVRTLHVPWSGEDWCREDGEILPCSTLKALDGPQPSPATFEDCGSA